MECRDGGKQKVRLVSRTNQRRSQKSSKAACRCRARTVSHLLIESFHFGLERCKIVRLAITFGLVVEFIQLGLHGIDCFLHGLSFFRNEAQAFVRELLGTMEIISLLTKDGKRTVKLADNLFTARCGLSMVHGLDLKGCNVAMMERSLNYRVRAAGTRAIREPKNYVRTGT